jgi:hypothetical protein
VTPKDEDLPALQELETAIVMIWRRHPDMTDYVANRAYEAAVQFHRARSRGHEPKPSGLTGLDLDAFNAVQQVCENLLSTGAAPRKGLPTGNTAPISLEKLLEYLRELNRSVERHTRHGGRQGYLQFIDDFLK